MNPLPPKRRLARMALGLPLLLALGCPPSTPHSTTAHDSSGDEDIAFPDEARANAPDPHPAEGAVADAERVLAGGDVAHAESMLRQAVEATPNDARARLDLGLVLELQNHYDQAEEQYLAALAIDADFAEAASNLGLLLRDRHRLDEALPLLRHAVEVSPALSEAWMNLALALEDSDQGLAALDAYRRAVRLEPDQVAPRVNMALLLITLDRKDEAAIELRRALSHAQGDAAMLLAIGNGLRRSGQPAAAVRALNLAIEAHDGGPTPALLAELASAQAAAGDRDAAEATLQQALTLDAHYAAAHYMLAGLLAASGRYPEAITHYEAVLRAGASGALADRARERIAAARRASQAH